MCLICAYNSILNHVSIRMRRNKTEIITGAKCCSGGTGHGRTSSWYGQCTRRSSHPWSSGSSGDCPRSFSGWTSLANQLSSSTSSSNSSSSTETLRPTKWSTSEPQSLFGQFSISSQIFFFPHWIGYLRLYVRGLRNISTTMKPDNTIHHIRNKLKKQSVIEKNNKYKNNSK